MVAKSNQNRAVELKHGCGKKLSLIGTSSLITVNCWLVYGLRLPDAEFPPSRGEAHRAACLHALALFRLS